ncbi:aminodeoxychorismate/anthranilate synthase component II [Caloramator sp. CAR-1]|uniref:anthranilate synthase component II n=1 Tax=Caloramator sp. CAR-1 TaxID=3062777 RepID=UPI0026E2AD0C|nr:aminodeoxychorismate/anthranilate synthase component II [Caloramator sp. CAR-1]MDO6355687.1 aminodeoxychorismate/anthranilate synthase component II [Caloramator sp. CAR-1]
MVLIIDNFDSFTYNLYHYFLILGQDVLVKGRHEIDIRDVKNINPDYIVLSPGPGSPEEAILPLEVIDKFKGEIPILGVCLGHQCIGHYFGGKVVKGLRPVHGKVNEINHFNKGVFKNLKNPLKVTRYHSLVVSKEDLPDELEITALTLEGEIMGIRHKEYNIEGVQFHPEAILTENGLDMLNNFLRSGKNA